MVLSKLCLKVSVPDLPFKLLAPLFLLIPHLAVRPQEWPANHSIILNDFLRHILLNNLS